jgi:SAM-dependent methyltransferase
MSASDDLEGFYREGYQRSPEEAERMGRWRALGAGAKAGHVVELCARGGLSPASLVEIGCGDGALLAELSARGFGGELSGFELSEPAVEIARARAIPGVVRLDAYDGTHIPAEDGTWDLGVLSHVLEHVPEPPELLREAARVCTAVVVEVPLEANWSARRASKRAGADEIGHLHSFDRAAVRAFVEAAGMRIVSDLADPLRYEAHAFFADSTGARAKATAKAAVRRGLWIFARRLAERAFTVHYAALCTR